MHRAVASLSCLPTDRRLAPAADRRAINLGRSVLGAATTLEGAYNCVKTGPNGLVAICDLFFSHRVALRIRAHALVLAEGQKGAGHRGPAARIRRAGNAFVHLPDEPSASA